MTSSSPSLCDWFSTTRNKTLIEGRRKRIRQKCWWHQEASFKVQCVTLGRDLTWCCSDGSVAHEDLLAYKVRMHFEHLPCRH